jgi:hypothetical protein
VKGDLEEGLYHRRMFASRGLRFSSDDIGLAHCRHHALGRVRRETVCDRDGQVISEVDFPDYGFMSWYCNTMLSHPGCRWSYYRIESEVSRVCESFFESEVKVDLLPHPPDGWLSDFHVGACMYEVRVDGGKFVPASDFMLDSNPLVYEDLKELFFTRNSVRFNRYRVGEYVGVVSEHDVELSSRIRQYHLSVLNSTGKPARPDTVPPELFNGFPEEYLAVLRHDGRIVSGKCGKPEDCV